jgi:hypothetical protein
MKGLAGTWPVLIALALLPAAASAQAPSVKSPVSRADLTGSIGWLNDSRQALADTEYDQWHNHGIHGSAILGWYWTDHLKTEVDISRSTTGRLWAYDELRSGTVTAFRQIRYRIAATDLAITQRYQFGRNAFFHPFVGAGVDFAWETISGTAEAAGYYGPGAIGPVQIVPAQNIGPDTRFRARIAAESGFKAYLSERVFFRSDLRVAGLDRVDTMLLRFGFGVDF